MHEIYRNQLKMIETWSGQKGCPMLNWRVEKSDIDTEYLSGDYKHRCELPRGECRQMFWIPRNKDAELRVTLKTGARVLLQE